MKKPGSSARPPGFKVGQVLAEWGLDKEKFMLDREKTVKKKLATMQEHIHVEVAGGIDVDGGAPMNPAPPPQKKKKQAHTHMPVPPHTPPARSPRLSNPQKKKPCPTQ